MEGCQRRKEQTKLIHIAQPSSSTIFTRHCEPHLRMAPSAMNPVMILQSPRIVISQPLPIAFSTGSAIIAPVKEQMLRTKLFKAMPEAARFGINSVNMVETRENINMDPTPKKTVVFVSKVLLVVRETYSLQSWEQSTMHPSQQSSHTISVPQAIVWLLSRHSLAYDPQA